MANSYYEVSEQFGNAYHPAGIMYLVPEDHALHLLAEEFDGGIFTAYIVVPVDTLSNGLPWVKNGLTHHKRAVLRIIDHQTNDEWELTAGQVFHSCPVCGEKMRVSAWPCECKACQRLGLVSYR